MLDSLGLDADKERVYWALLVHPDLGVAELAVQVGLTEPEVHAAMDALGELTLLRTSRESPDRLRPVSPEHGLQILLARQEDELSRLQREIAASRVSVAELVSDLSDRRRRDADVDSERVIGLDAIQAKMEELTAGAKSDCRSIVPGGPLPAATLESCRPLDEELLTRGIRQRVLYQDSAMSSTASVAYATWMTSLGAEVRVSPVLPPRMLIVDSAIALVPLVPDAPAEGAMCVSAAGLVAMLIALFEQTWDLAAPLDTGADADPGGRPPGLSDTDRALLGLLASGMTDEAAAKRLGVSMRTVRRRMDKLMTQLGAGSRFEAGLKASERGWLS